jgi:acyl transferase domain-containing protein
MTVSTNDLDIAAPRIRDVAIVGMACVMPGAPDTEAFWANIVDGVDSVTEVPATRWTLATHYDPDHDSSARGAGRDPMSVSKWGGFVPDVGFDALRWGIPPASLASIDPAQLLALQAAAGALDDAGYGEGGFDRDRASVVYATGSGGAADLPAGFLLRLLLRTHGVPVDALPPELDAFLPELTEDGLPGVLTSLIAGRVANRLDLGGKNLTVDSACASVLVALDIACNELAGGSSDLVLLGGVDLHNGPQDYVSFSAAQALSRSGRCRSFDASADGMTLAEGVGCLVLRRLADARRDGDRIYAVVRGVAGSSDGRHLGLTAPNQAGQVKAVRRAYAESGLSPREVGLVEAHGTGTPTGDRIELGTTTEVFTAAGAAPGSVVLGSVKSNIGHVKCAAGIASLIKTARSLYYGVQPPTLHLREPIDSWDAATSPFVFLERARPWTAERRVAGVSSFGFGGTNFHAVLESEPAALPPVARHHWPTELVTLRAGDLAALDRRLRAALAGLHQADRWRLRDVAAAASSDGDVEVAIVAADLPDLATKVAAACAGQPAAGVYRAPVEPLGPGVAFLAPSTQAPLTGPAGDLLVAFPALRDEVDDFGVTTAALARLGVGGPVIEDGDRLAEQVREVHATGVRLFVEVGPGTGLCEQVDRALAGEPHDAVPVQPPGEHGLTALLHALARLAVAGVAVDLAALHEGRDSRPERWDDPPPAPGWIVNGHFVRTAAGDPLPKGLRPADAAPVLDLMPRAAPAPAPAPAEGGLSSGELEVITQYLSILQGMVAAGSDIVRDHVSQDGVAAGDRP